MDAISELDKLAFPRLTVRASRGFPFCLEFHGAVEPSKKQMLVHALLYEPGEFSFTSALAILGNAVCQTLIPLS